MANKDTPKDTPKENTTAAPAVDAAAPAAPARKDIALRLGTTVAVQVADGLDLVNNETGKQFVPGQATLQTVTVLTLRRLQDGDLQLV